MGERDLSGLSESLVSPDEPEASDNTDEEANTDPEASTSTGSTTTSGDDIGSSSNSAASPAHSESSEPSGSNMGASTQCQETTRGGTQCDHDALPNSRYCKKHQPDKFGHQRGDFKRKQWTLLPEVANKLFNDSVTADSLYVNVQKEVGEEFQKKSIENKMGEFLISREEEFIEYVSREYNER